jgi:Tol biopolymer transport system component
MNLPTRQLTFDGVYKTDPCYLDGGQAIAFTKQVDGFRMALHKLRLTADLAEKGTVEILHPAAKNPELKPVFAADGSAYVYLESRGNQDLRAIYRRVGENGDKTVAEHGRQATLSADGRRVFYAQPKDSGQQIFSRDPAGGDPQDLTRSASYNGWPAVSTDGRWLAFGSNRDGDLDLYVMPSTGGPTRRVTHSPGRDIRPAWSPDGRQLAFTSSRSGASNLYVMAVDGDDALPITSGPEPSDYATWHPEAKQIAFVGQREGKYDLYVIDLADLALPGAAP